MFKIYDSPRSNFANRLSRSAKSCLKRPRLRAFKVLPVSVTIGIGNFTMNFDGMVIQLDKNLIQYSRKALNFYIKNVLCNSRLRKMIEKSV